MAAEQKIGAAFIEVVLKGMSAVQTDLNKVKSALQSTGQFATDLQKKLNSTPLALALELDKARSGIVDQVRKEIERLPRTVQIAFVADKIKAVEDEIKALEADLKKIPDSKEIKAKLILAQGVKGDLKKELESVEARPAVKPQIKALEAANAYTAELQKTINNTPLALALKLDKSRSDLVEQVKQQIEGLPKEKRIAFVADKIAAVEAEIKRLQDELKKTPNSKEIKAKLTFAQNVKADLDKQMKGMKAPDFSGMFDGLASKIAPLKQALEGIGAAAQKGFLGATAAVFGFIRAADPYAFAQFSGTLAALAVQIGSIFLPIIDKVNKYLERLLGWFRSLSDQQKDAILKWVAIGIAVLGLIAIIPKIIALFNLASAAMSFFGVTTGVATGGITTILGILAALIPAVLGVGVVMGTAGDSAGIFGAAMDALKPIIDSLMKVFNVLKDAFSKVAEAVAPVIEKLAEAFGKLVSGVAPILEALVSLFAKVFGDIATKVAQMIDRLLPIFTAFMDKVLPIWQGLFEKITPLVQQFFDRIMPLFDQLMTRVAPLIARFYEMVAQLWERLGPVFETIVTIIGAQLDTLATVFEAVFPLIIQAIEHFMAMAMSLMQVVAPILTILGRIVKVFGDMFAQQMKIIGGVIAALMPIFEAISGIFNALVEVVASLLAPAFELLTIPLQIAVSLIEALVEAMEPMVPIIIRMAQAVRDVMVPMFKQLADTLKAMIGFVYDTIDNMIDAINRAIETANKLPGINIALLNKPTRPDFSVGGAGVPGLPDDKKDKDKKKKDEAAGRHAPQATGAVQIGGLVDAWKKAQEAVRPPTAEEKAAMERLELQRKQLAEQETTNEWLKRLLGADRGAIGP